MPQRGAKEESNAGSGGKVQVQRVSQRAANWMAAFALWWGIAGGADAGQPMARESIGTLRAAKEASAEAMLSASAAPLSRGVAGTPPGTEVYRNEPGGSLVFYVPRSGERMADDLRLASGATNLKYFSLVVVGSGANTFPFNAHVEFWNGDPCEVGSAVIPGTGVDFSSIPNNQTLQMLEATYPTAIPVPETVWMAVIFSGAGANNAGWIVADEAELGFTANYFSENNQVPPPAGCELYILGGNPPRYAGFWATVNAELSEPPQGACCNGTTCTLTTEGNCVGGMWQGPFTGCEPNVCLTGACCQGVDFELCVDSNEASCSGGIFRPLETCASGACGPNFEIYENDFPTLVVVPIPGNQKWGDDLTLAPGTPCELTAYDIVVGGVSDPVVNFAVQLELWTNFDNGTPTLESDDVPLAPIPGTAKTVTGIPADATRHTVLVAPSGSVILPPKVWIVMSATHPGGPEFGGLADIGSSVDGFAIFNHASGPDRWTPGFFFDPGFDPTNCPGPQCIPAGSFRVNLWCAGNPPTGACCSNASGTCRENVTASDCNGRWAQNETCKTAGFDPPCGVSACCFRFPPNPDFIMCQDLTEEDCILNEGDRSPPGVFCANTQCPRPTCIDATGDCFATHGGRGCRDAFCCEEVCSQGSFYEFCCTDVWDADCVAKAEELCGQGTNDDCTQSKRIVGPGTYDFDLTRATTDGPAHLACLAANETQVEKDVWYCWEATCTGRVVVRLCEINGTPQTTLDTKIAVYNGCACPVTDANLLECNDDLCGLQSMAVFDAVAGRSYLIRVGLFPGSEAGSGTFTISCGPPSNPACPSTGDCCVDLNARACGDANCCNMVCACDPYCCDVEWDEDCASTGFENSGCGAVELCGTLCRDACPVGPITFQTPSSGVVDARFPHAPADASQKLGIDTFTVLGPQGAQDSCWSVCDSAGNANSISSIVEVGGTYTISLAQPIPAGAVTTLTYTASDTTRTRAQFTFHPGNVNALNTAGAQDVLDLVAALQGSFSLPHGTYSGDVDFSGLMTALDVLAAIDLLNGAGEFQAWNETPLPTLGTSCP